MKWDWNDNGWRRGFALFPIYISDGPEKTLIWLQWVWTRDMGMYREVSLTNPTDALKQGEA